MTFTKDEVNVGKALHTQLNQTEKVRRAIPCSFEDRQAYREKKDEVRSFWLRHGEAALAALEEAWEARGLLRAIRTRALGATPHNTQLELYLWLKSIGQAADKHLQAAEEEQ